MNNENAFVCYAKNPVTFVASDALADVFYTNYEYFTDAAHLVTCTISCDFREITRMSATRFLFPIFRHLYLFSFRFYIYSKYCSARGSARTETWFRTKPRAMLWLIHQQRRISLRKRFRGELALIVHGSIRPPTMRTQTDSGMQTR